MDTKLCYLLTNSENRFNINTQSFCSIILKAIIAVKHKAPDRFVVTQNIVFIGKNTVT